MVTKAQILSIDYIANTCKLRMPLFENVNNDNVIADATFSIAPGVFNNYAVGDMVYVAFENDIWHEPVVIGKLYLGANKEANINQGAVYASDLNISSSAILPASTKIKFAADTKLTGNLDKYTSLADMANSIQKLEKTCSVVSFDDVAQNEQQKTDLAEYITINGVRKKIAATMSDLPDFSAYDRKIQEDFKAADDKLNWEIEKVDYQINELDEEQHTITTRIDSVETATDNKLGELKKETDTALQIAIGEIHSWVDEQIKDADGHIIKELRTDIEQNSRAIDLVAQEQTKDAYNIAKLEVTANQISSSVSSLSSDLALTKSSIEQTADQIKMEVSSGYVKNNDFNIEDTFGWNMTTDGVNFYDESKDVLKIDETGIKVAGTIEAESGHIGVTYDSIKTIEYKDFFYDSEIWTFDSIAETTENSTTTYQLLYKSNSTNPQYVLLVNRLPNLVDRESFPCEIYLANDETFQNKILDINISLDEIINEGYYTEYDGTPSDPSDPGYYYKITITDDAIKKELVTNKIITVVYNGDDDEWQWNTHNRTYTVEQPEAAPEPESESESESESEPEVEPINGDTTLVFYNNEVEFEVSYDKNLPTDNSTVYLFYEERWAKGAVDNGYQQYICDNDEHRIIQFTTGVPNTANTYQIKATENIINCDSFSIKRYKIAKVSLEPSDPNAGFTIGTNSIYNTKTSFTNYKTNGIYLGTDGIALGAGENFDHERPIFENSDINYDGVHNFMVTNGGELLAQTGIFGFPKILVDLKTPKPDDPEVYTYADNIKIMYGEEERPATESINLPVYIRQDETRWFIHSAPREQITVNNNLYTLADFYFQNANTHYPYKGRNTNLIAEYEYVDSNDNTEILKTSIIDISNIETINDIITYEVDLKKNDESLATISFGDLFGITNSDYRTVLTNYMRYETAWSLNVKSYDSLPSYTEYETTFDDIGKYLTIGFYTLFDGAYIHLMKSDHVYQANLNISNVHGKYVGGGDVDILTDSDWRFPINSESDGYWIKINWQYGIDYSKIDTNTLYLSNGFHTKDKQFGDNKTGCIFSTAGLEYNYIADNIQYKTTISNRGLESTYASIGPLQIRGWTDEDPNPIVYDSGKAYNFKIGEKEIAGGAIRRKQMQPYIGMHQKTSLQDWSIDYTGDNGVALQNILWAGYYWPEISALLDLYKKNNIYKYVVLRDGDQGISWSSTGGCWEISDPYITANWSKILDVKCIETADWGGVGGINVANICYNCNWVEYTSYLSVSPLTDGSYDSTHTYTLYFAFRVEL